MFLLLKWLDKNMVEPKDVNNPRQKLKSFYSWETCSTFAVENKE